MSDLSTDVEPDLVLEQAETESSSQFLHNNGSRIDYSKAAILKTIFNSESNRYDSGVGDSLQEEYSSSIRLETVNNLFDGLSVADNASRQLNSNNSISLANFKSDSCAVTSIACQSNFISSSVSPGAAITQQLRSNISDREHLDSGVLESLNLSPHQSIEQTEYEPEQYVLNYYQPDEDGDTDVHNTIIQRKPNYALQIISLSACYDWLNHQNNLSQTPLHLAVLTNQPQVVRRLMVGGAIVDLRDSKGNTPLHIACLKGYSDIVKMLLTPIFHNEIHINKYEIPFQKLPQDLEMRNYDGLSCLHLAAQGNHIENMRLLLQNRANINIADGKSGRTILHYAAECGNENMLKFMLQNPAININEKTYGGLTAIALAKGRGYLDALELLYVHGADTSGLDDNEDDSEDDMDTMYDDIEICGEPVSFT